MKIKNFPLNFRIISGLRIFQRFLQMSFEQRVFSYYQRNRENLAPWIFLPSPIFELVSLFSFSRLPVFDQLLVKLLYSKLIFILLEVNFLFSLKLILIFFHFENKKG